MATPTAADVQLQKLAQERKMLVDSIASQTERLKIVDTMIASVTPIATPVEPAPASAAAPQPQPAK